MSQGLPLSLFVSTSVVLLPTAVQTANVNTAMIIGDSTVIDVGQRFRSYANLAGVASDFGTSAPEYLAALLFFGQSPQPQSLYIGRWAQTATPCILKGAALTAAQQALSNFTGLTSSGFKISLNGGAAVAVTVGTLAGAASLTAVAAIITTGLTTATVAASCTWNSALGCFEFQSTATGSSQTSIAITAPASGTDINTAIFCEAASNPTNVPGVNAESAATGFANVELAAPFFYGLQYATTYTMVTADHLAIAAAVQADQANHLYFATTSDTSHLTTGSTSNLGYSLMNAGYTRSAVQFSSTTAFASASLMGRIITVDYTGQNTSITVMFKQEPGVAAETLTVSQKTALDSYRVNYLANVNNGTAIVVNGWCSAIAYIDEMAAMDAYALTLQTALYNVLYSQPKVPQTDKGIGLLTVAADAVGQQFVGDGTLAPGIWTGPALGAINPGDTLVKGFYTYAAPVATQSAADRAARKSPTIQQALKFAGAVQSISAIVNVVR